jgi:hypothetical protein
VDRSEGALTRWSRLFLVAILAVTACDDGAAGRSTSADPALPDTTLALSGAAARNCDFPFARRLWCVKSGNSIGPGPNDFDAENVFIDRSGQLHLRIARGADGKWRSAEVYSPDSLGYGTFDFQVGSRVDRLDANVVLGLFTYPGGSLDGTQEIDIEFTRWANPANTNLHYTVHPAVPMTSVDNGADVQWVSATAASTHRFTWSAAAVHFQGFASAPPATAAPTAEWTFAPREPARAISKGRWPVHINLWLYRTPSQVKSQQAAAPSTFAAVEVIIRDFSYTAQAAAGNVSRPQP